MGSDFIAVGVDLADASEITRRELMRMWRQKASNTKCFEARLSGAAGETGADASERVNKALDEVQSALDEKHRQGVIFGATCHQCGSLANLLIAGGMSGGDDPSELFGELTLLWESGVFSLNVVERVVLERRIIEANGGVAGG